MKAQAEELTETFADGTVDRVQAMKKADAQLGLDQANDMLGVLAPDSPDWTRLNVSGLENMSANLADGSPLKKLIMESAKESAKEVEDTLLNGIAIGQGTSHIGWVMSQVSNLPYERAYRIARTEIARAYRSASHEQYKKSGIIIGYRRMCYKPTACFACLMMDGEFYPIGQGALQDHPNGKCTPIPVLEGHENDTPKWQTGREWFDGLTEDDQRKLMGNGRYELWKEQNISPRRMVFMKDNKVWGASPAIKTVESLKAQEQEDEKNARKNQPTSVNWDYVKSQEYRDKFSSITDDDKVNRVLYNKAIDILRHRQNTDFEDMHLIDSGTGKVVATQAHSKTPHMVNYNDEMKQAVKKYKGRLITIHNHPNSLPPSGPDFASNYNRDYELGVVVAHNGDVYVYNNNDKTFATGNVDSIIGIFPSSMWEDKFKEVERLYNISWEKR